MVSAGKPEALRRPPAIALAKVAFSHPEKKAMSRRRSGQVAAPLRHLFHPMWIFSLP
jgi:hypothetical protein